MIKKIFFVLVLISFVCFGQNKNCEDFKTGDFVYPDNPNKLSVRKGTLQESYSNGKLEMLWKVNWINDCMYEMICQKVYNDNIPIKVGDRIVTTILEADSKCYKFSFIIYNSFYPNGYDKPDFGEMCKK